MSNKRYDRGWSDGFWRRKTYRQGYREGEEASGMCGCLGLAILVIISILIFRACNG